MAEMEQDVARLRALLKPFARAIECASVAHGEMRERTTGVYAITPEHDAQMRSYPLASAFTEAHAYFEELAEAERRDGRRDASERDPETRPEIWRLAKFLHTQFSKADDWAAADKFGWYKTALRVHNEVYRTNSPYLKHEVPFEAQIAHHEAQADRDGRHLIS